MARRPKVIKDAMIGVLEEAIKQVLNDPKSLPSDRVRAVEAGTKLQLMKHKTSEGTKDGNYFDVG